MLGVERGTSSAPSGPHTSTAADPIVLPIVIVFAYLSVVLYIGIFAFRRRGTHEPAEQDSSRAER